jgi:hypothetical protein
MEPTREQIKEQDDGWWCHAWRHCFSRIYEILHLHIFSSNWAPSWADLAGKAHHRSLFSFLGKSFRDVRFKGRSSVHTLFFLGKKTKTSFPCSNIYVLYNFDFVHIYICRSFNLRRCQHVSPGACIWNNKLCPERDVARIRNHPRH